MSFLYAGLTGATGFTGDTGFTGSTGDTGFTGDTGAESCASEMAHMSLVTSQQPDSKTAKSVMAQSGSLQRSAY